MPSGSVLAMLVNAVDNRNFHIDCSIFHGVDIDIYDEQFVVFILYQSYNVSIKMLSKYKKILIMENLYLVMYCKYIISLQLWKIF